MISNIPTPRRTPSKIASTGKPAIGTTAVLVIVVIICVLVIMPVVFIIPLVIVICSTSPARLTGGAKRVLAVKAITASKAIVSGSKPRKAQGDFIHEITLMQRLLQCTAKESCSARWIEAEIKTMATLSRTQKATGSQSALSFTSGNPSSSGDESLRFLLRLAHDRKLSPKDRKELSKTAWEAVSGHGADVGNLRIATRAVELDLLLDSEAALADCTRALAEIIGPVLTVRKLDVISPPIEKVEAVRHGVELFNEERYWESHELLESAWKESTGVEREVLQGLILLAAALVHWQKNEKEVTLSIMGRALQKLETHDADLFNVKLDSAKHKVNEILNSGQPIFFQLESK
jgi:hypothetical protein